MKVGDYCRTKDGIKKVLKYTYNDKYENGHCVWFDNKDYGILFTDEEVNEMKPSPNIIDLIEEGDYVNGNKITCILDTTIYTADDQLYYDKEDNFIKSIVTKECFESMEYKVGDD